MAVTTSGECDADYRTASGTQNPLHRASVRSRFAISEEQQAWRVERFFEICGFVDENGILPKSFDNRETITVKNLLGEGVFEYFVERKKLAICGTAHCTADVSIKIGEESLLLHIVNALEICRVLRNLLSDDVIHAARVAELLLVKPLDRNGSIFKGHGMESKYDELFPGELLFERPFDFIADVHLLNGKEGKEPSQVVKIKGETQQRDKSPHCNPLSKSALMIECPVGRRVISIL